jgi:hypothetical protein
LNELARHTRELEQSFHVPAKQFADDVVHVTAGAEGLARPRDHDTADGAVLVGLESGMKQLAPQRQAVVARDVRELVEEDGPAAQAGVEENDVIVGGVLPPPGAGKRLLTPSMEMNLSVMRYAISRVPDAVQRET